MNQMHNQKTHHSQWINLFAWLVLLAAASAVTAWGAPSRYARDDRYGRDDRREHIDDRTRASEVDFIQRMIDYESAAGRVARSAMDKASHGEMRDYLDRLDRQSSRRVDRLQGMMSSWYGNRYEPRIDPKYEQRADMFRRSNMSGSEFEIRLLKTLIDLNQEESIMAERYQSRLRHSDLQSMAGTVLNRRSDVANQLQDWLKKWYDISYTSDAGRGRVY